ncbi:MAG: hypothetical protein LUD12_07030 [Lachnospiraceae bacterium]|nr:hypothetical protein [Lachnospiraceae bacterium]
MANKVVPQNRFCPYVLHKDFFNFRVCLYGLPGVSGRDSIRQNHRRALDPEMVRPMGIEAGTDLGEC